MDAVEETDRGCSSEKDGVAERLPGGDGRTINGRDSDDDERNGKPDGTGRSEMNVKEEGSSTTATKTTLRETKTSTEAITMTTTSTIPTSREAEFDPKSVVAVDCEMVGVGWKMESALARCSIVDGNGETLMDTYVIPPSGIASITDYRTSFSGIRPRHMKGATPFHDAVRVAQSLMKDKVVVGHDIKNDFAALSFQVPPSKVRDTLSCSHLFRLAEAKHAELQSSGARNLPKLGRRLKSLTYYVLGRTIQRKGGHDSVEDAKATMDLYLAVREEWEQDMGFAAWIFGPGSKQFRKEETPTAKQAHENNNDITTVETLADPAARLYQALERSSRDGSKNSLRRKPSRSINNNKHAYFRSEGRQKGSSSRRASAGRTDSKTASSPTRGGSTSVSPAPRRSRTSTSPVRRRSRTSTVTSEEMSEFVGDRFWNDFPDDEDGLTVEDAP